MICGVVLAAGLSSRMGEDKLLLPLDGQYVVEHAIQAARDVCEVQLVVSKQAVSDALRLPCGVNEVVNEHPERGMSSSVACAIEWLKRHRPDCEGVLFFLGDEPDVDPHLAVRVRDALRDDPSSIAAGRFEGRTCHPVGFGRVWFDELASMTGDQGGRAVMRAHPDAVRWIEAGGKDGPAMDIDTREDYCRMMFDPRQLVVVRGAGDIATGVIVRMHRAGFRVVALDIEAPTVIRRTVSFAPALFTGKAMVEGIEAARCATSYEIAKALGRGAVPVVVDPEGRMIDELRPSVVVDAILAKRNLGTTMSMAPVVVAVGPGFTAGVDCHAVIETKRGHELGRVIYSGSAFPNTGVPGMIAGYSKERVIHAPAAGKVSVVRDIGSLVERGDLIAMVGDVEVRTPLAGVVRGMISDGSTVPCGLKMADVDPRGEVSYCFSVSDKARAVAGGCLEAIMHLGRRLRKAS